jgi:hypothetical protein
LWGGAVACWALPVPAPLPAAQAPACGAQQRVQPPALLLPALGWQRPAVEGVAGLEAPLPAQERWKVQGRGAAGRLPVQKGRVRAQAWLLMQWAGLQGPRQLLQTWLLDLLLLYSCFCTQGQRAAEIKCRDLVCAPFPLHLVLLPEAQLATTAHLCGCAATARSCLSASCCSLFLASLSFCRSRSCCFCRQPDRQPDSARFACRRDLFTLVQPCKSLLSTHPAPFPL